MKLFALTFRYRPIAGPGPDENFELIQAPSMAAAKRNAKAMVGTNRQRQCLHCVEPYDPQWHVLLRAAATALTGEPR
jgi:hypothetical protein